MGLGFGLILFLIWAAAAYFALALAVLGPMAEGFGEAVARAMLLTRAAPDPDLLRKPLVQGPETVTVGPFDLLHVSSTNVWWIVPLSYAIPATILWAALLRLVLRRTQAPETRHQGAGYG